MDVTLESRDANEDGTQKSESSVVLLSLEANRRSKTIRDWALTRTLYENETIFLAYTVTKDLATRREEKCSMDSLEATRSP